MAQDAEGKVEGERRGTRKGTFRGQGKGGEARSAFNHLRL